MSAAGEWAALRAACGRDLRMAIRRPSELLLALAFALLIAMLFGIALAGDPRLLAKVGPAVLYTTLVLAAFLALARMFADDLEDGTLDQLLVSGSSLTAVLHGKVIAFWLLNGVGLTLTCPILLLLLNLPVSVLPVLLLACLLTTFGMTLLGLVGAALTARLRGGAMLLALLVLPLNVPLLIFGLGAVMARLQDAPALPALALAGAQVLLLWVLAPVAAAYGLRATAE